MINSGKSKNRKYLQIYSTFRFYDCLGKRRNGKWTKISLLAIKIFLIFGFILKLEKWKNDTFSLTHFWFNIFFGQLKMNTNSLVESYLLFPFFKKIEYAGPCTDPLTHWPIEAIKVLLVWVFLISRTRLFLKITAITNSGHWIFDFKHFFENLKNGSIYFLKRWPSMPDNADDFIQKFHYHWYNAPLLNLSMKQALKPTKELC